MMSNIMQSLLQGGDEMIPTLTACKKAYEGIGWTGVYRLFLLDDGQITVHGDGTRGNGAELVSIRVDAADFEETGKRAAARKLQRRFVSAMNETI